MMQAIISVILQILSMCPIVMMSSRWHNFRSGISSTRTMPNPQQTAPATK